MRSREDNFGSTYCNRVVLQYEKQLLIKLTYNANIYFCPTVPQNLENVWKHDKI
jgi:hypothetical protein